MPFEFEALVGYLYVVGGRSISTTPPGALVEAAPKKVARGREADTLFVLTAPASKSSAPAAFYEQLARSVAQRYFNSTGSVTSGLRDVFNTLNYQLGEKNRQEGNGYEANLLCAVLRGNDLIIGRVGAVAALVLSNGEMRSFPEDLQDSQAFNLDALGALPMPNVKMMQCQISAGTRVVFGDASLTQMDYGQIGNALMSSDVGAVLVGFKELSRLQAALMVVEFVPSGMPSSPTIPEGQSTAEVSAKMRNEASSRPSSKKGKSRRRKKEPVTEKLQKRAKKGTGRTALGLSRFLRGLDQTAEHFFGAKKEGGRGLLSSPIGVGMVFLLPMIVVAAVVLLWITNTGESGYDLCVQEVNDRVTLAHSPDVVTSDRQMIINAWNLVLAQVEECRLIQPQDFYLDSIHDEGQAVLDQLYQIVRREASVVLSIEGGVSLTHIVAQGQNLYVLDSANMLVYQVTLTDDGLQSARPGGTPIREMRRGGTASGIPVGDIFDITYNEQKNTLVAVDRDGVLIECSPRFLQCTGRRLLGVENWVTPTAVAVWDNRIYILDTGVGNGQIWRYDSVGDTYNSAPIDYFGGVSMPILRSAVDFAIDDSGSVYVLLAEGILNKYFGGTSVPFQFAAFPQGQEMTSATSMFLDDRPTSQNIYVVEQHRRAIHETSLIGNFRSTYRIFDEHFFDLISSAVIVDGGNQDLIYAVSGNTIFVLTKE
jgi:hypothetical protein